MSRSTIPTITLVMAVSIFCIWSVIFAHSVSASTSQSTSASVEASEIVTYTVYLPAVAKASVWSSIAANDEDINALSIGDNRLYMANRNNNATGGIYYLDNCAGALSGPNPSEPSMFDVDIQNGHGLAIAFNAKTYYSTNIISNTWNQTTSNIIRDAYAISFGDGTANAYAGTNNGIYRSSDSGVTWRELSQNIVPDLQFVVGLWYDDASQNLWIGTFTNGAWVWHEKEQKFEHVKTGLSESNKSIEVWDFVLDTGNSGRMFAATSNGVYRLDSNSQWQPFGQGLPAQERIYALAIDPVTELIYAGARNNGVWSIKTDNSNNTWGPVVGGSNWSASHTVRDLIYDTTICNGLVAATTNGVWIFR